MSLRLLAPLVTLPFFSMGCELVPTVGDPVIERCVNADSDPSTSVSYERDIVPMFMMRCAPCHDPNGANNLGFEVGALDVTSHAALLLGGVTGGPDIVIPGRPCDSILIQKSAAAPPFGSRMPFDGPPFLEETNVQRLRDWIAEGAKP
jgi:hypothetical protein